MRVSHAPDQRIEEHAHLWPCLTLHVLGGYRERSETGESEIGGPGAVLQPAGAAHANFISAAGLETVSIFFDPAWLAGNAVDRPRVWRGGSAGAAARGLARAWCSGQHDERALAAHTSAFLHSADAVPRPPKPPAWLARVEAVIATPGADTKTAARAAGLSTDALARAYRQWTGEGLRETMRRRRLERAIASLRTDGVSLADAAALNGYCDQSHLNRECRALLGRTSGEIAAGPR